MALHGKPIDYYDRKEAVVHAAPEAVFAILSDFSRHPELAGSGELVDIRTVTSGPTTLGTVVEANESIQLGDDLMEFPARSVVVACDPPKTLSWIPVPPMPIRRIQWWFELIPEAGDTRVVHEVEVDLGDEGREIFGGTQGYLTTRALDVSKGMDATLEHLQKAAAG